MYDADLVSGLSRVLVGVGGTRDVARRSVSIVYQVDAAQVCVSVVISGLIGRISSGLGAWWARLFRGVTVGADDERRIVLVV